MNWPERQHDCEEATVVMVGRFLSGDRTGGLIDPHTAEAAINRITPWKAHEDLTDKQLGELVKQHLGWGYRIYPATRENIKGQLTLGRPVIVGVWTHGLGNPNYPGFQGHYEQSGSVSHYLVVTGYDKSDTLDEDQVRRLLRPIRRWVDRPNYDGDPGYAAYALEISLWRSDCRMRVGGVELCVDGHHDRSHTARGSRGRHRRRRRGRGRV